MQPRPKRRAELSRRARGFDHGAHHGRGLRFHWKGRCRFAVILRRVLMSNVVNVGVVAYDPKVVTIWEGIKEYFEANGVPMDFVLFSNYDAQVDALLKGWIDIAWNTNLPYVKVHRRTDGKCGVLAMRDTDVSFTSKLVAGAGTGVENLGGLKGKRVAFGSRDSGQARILPAYFLKRNGIDPARDITAIHFDLDVGKHGDTGTS